MPEPTIFEDYRDNEDLRNKFYKFTQIVFPGVNFIDWYNLGFWSDKYIPISVIEDNKVVSNVSVSRMKIFIDGNYLNGIQIGTVGTIPAYRNKGLSRFLMDYVLKKYEDLCDIYFLFANDTVLEFYTKFGFNRYQEVIYKSSSDIPISTYRARKLNILNHSDLSIIRKHMTGRRPLTKIFGATEYDFITHWHLLNVFTDNLYYLEDEGAIFICNEKNDQLHIWDVIFTTLFDHLKAVSRIIRNKDLQSVLYYYPPDQLSYKYDEVIADKASYLFVRGDFRIKDRNFKFPVTAQT